MSERESRLFSAIPINHLTHVFIIVVYLNKIANSGMLKKRHLVKCFKAIIILYHKKDGYVSSKVEY